MIVLTDVPLKGKKARGIKVDLGNAPLYIIRGNKGYLACGYLDMKTAEGMGDAAVLMTKASSFEDMLNNKAKSVSKKAKSLGVKSNMTGKQALEKLI